MTSPLMIGTAVPAVEALTRRLGADFEEVPRLAPVEGPAAFGWPWSDELDRWRSTAGAGVASDSVTVAVWADELGEPASLDVTDHTAWITRAEVPMARWFAAMGAAATRCVDGGSIVAVIERPPPLDSAGWAPESGISDAVESMVRSLARAEGSRSVRVNAVTTPVRLHRAPLVDPAPSLATFPGTIEHEVLGAVELLHRSGAGGLTGTVVDADCGRSWR